MKTALITGGTGGIGNATAQLFKEHGYEVFITYNSTEPDYAGTAAFRCDMRDCMQIEKLFSRFSSLDVLVNNAGVSLIKMINDTTPQDFENVVGVNLRGAYFAAKHASKLMLRKKSGAIINISSIWGEVGASCETLYSASKAGVIGFTKALAKELAPSGITVNSISPGVIDTRMNAAFSKEELIADIPLGRLGTAHDVARAALFLAENRYITGQDLSVSGGVVI
ncbi:MAG: SDR family oxidoreductase [Clostridiales bacterium]|nr:SDR family oxidoreductase [Clostridiales bacterium]MCD7722763.1 SDR family oxidoreductase [Clostridiales bacterium]